MSEESKFKQVIMRLAATSLAMGVKAYMRTVDSRIAAYHPTVDTVLENFKGPFLYVMWHEYILLTAATRRGSDMTLLVSQHRDAYWFNEVVSIFGFRTVRGSSTRGGIKAILQYMKEHKDTSLVLTPDGPRGPRRELSRGCVQLAALLNLPIVAVGCGFDNPWRNRSWDKFAVPRLGSRARIVLSTPIRIPRKLSESELDRHRLYVEQVLLATTLEAETWAADGQPRIGERGLYSAPHASVALGPSYLEMP